MRHNVSKEINIIFSCVRVQTCSIVYAYACGGLRLMSGIFLKRQSPFLFEAVSQSNSEITNTLVWLANLLTYPSASSFQGCYRWAPYPCDISVDSGNLNSSPLAFVARALTIGPPFPACDSVSKAETQSCPLASTCTHICTHKCTRTIESTNSWKTVLYIDKGYESMVGSLSINTQCPWFRSPVLSK